MGPISAAMAKLVWRNELRPVGWSRLALWSTAGAAIALVAGLVTFGRDGLMASYAAMVLAAAAGLMWSGFGPGRR